MNEKEETIKAVAEAVRKTAARWARYHNDSEDAANRKIYGEVCDAFNDLADNLEGILSK